VQQFLQATEVIDWTHPMVSSKAKELSSDGHANGYSYLSATIGLTRMARRAGM
jgi:hypothetical protein